MNGELPFGIQTRQLTETVIDSTVRLASNAQEDSDSIVSEGFNALYVFGISDTTFRIDVIERCTCSDQDDEELEPDGARTQTTSSNLDGTTSRQVVSKIFQITGKYVIVRRVNTGASAQTLSRFCAYLVPISPLEGGGGGGGSGSAGGPGDTVDTKADINVPAATETVVVNAADIPVGTRRITIQNVGANPARIKANAEGGGMARGPLLNVNSSISIGGVGGAISAMDAFSTLGTTIAILFERD